MGKIVRRGIDFSGGGGSSSNPTAASVTFDNANTGLNATNVQDAVTEVNGKLGELSVVQKQYNVTLSTNNLAAPYTHYGAFDLTDEIKKYGHAIGASLIDPNNVPRPVAIISEKYAGMVSNAPSNKLIVSFFKTK